MKLSLKYLTLALFVMALVGYVEYRGWTLSPARIADPVPPTIRDNPGAYRAHYARTTRHIGGK